MIRAKHQPKDSLPTSGRNVITYGNVTISIFLIPYAIEKNYI